MGPEAVKEEVRERIDLVDLVSQYVQLKQSGRNWKGLCPFHPEKTPSFNVNRESKFWKCFGCGAGGDVFSFVMRIENLTFPEAARMLAERVGVRWEPAQARPEERDEREQILRLNALASEWFTAALSGQAGKAARAYLDSRGLDDDTIARFRLGYAPPGWDGLVTDLARHGIGLEATIRAGLAKRSEQGSVYDVFRHRIIFPICDVAGKVIGFGGRALDPEDPARYLNSPETLVFRKGRTFYGLDLARRAISDEGFALVVEGYMDVIALVQHGIVNCVATLGTALTDQHARILGRYTPEIVLLYDADAAGMAAALRSVKVFEECPAAVKVVVLPEGKDPDDAVREFGPAGMRELLDQRIGLVEYRLRAIFASHSDQGTEGRTKAAQEAVDVLLGVRDLTRRQALLAWAADEWAGRDIKRAPSLESALLHEMQRRAKAAAPADRDGWQRVLAERGVPRARDWERRRRLARSEWLQQQLDRERLLVDVQIARMGQQSPDTPGSFVDQDFIREALSRSTSPFIRNVQRTERRLLTAMLADLRFAARAFEQLGPQDLLLPIHRDVASAVHGAVVRADDTAPKGLGDMLARDEAVFATAVDIAVSEEGYDQASLEGDARLIREARFLGNIAFRLYVVDDEAVEPSAEHQSFAELETEVQRRAAEGALSHDDPLYQRYISIKKHLHGKGRLAWWDYD